MVPKPPQATKGKDFPFGNLFASPVRTGRVGNDNIGILKGQNLPPNFSIFFKNTRKKQPLSV